MRRSIRAIVARLRERRRLYDELGMTALDREMDAACTAICAQEDAIAALEPSPNVTAATLMAKLSQDCCRSETAEDCGAMAASLLALRGLLPSLSGMIRDHAAFYVGNPAASLRELPFVTA